MYDARRRVGRRLFGNEVPTKRGVVVLGLVSAYGVAFACVVGTLFFRGGDHLAGALFFVSSLGPATGWLVALHRYRAGDRAIASE